MVWRILLAFTFFMVGSAVPAQAMLDSGQSGPPLETSPAILAAALHCHDAPSPAGQEPVLLVHGIGATGPGTVGLELRPRAQPRRL
jgi:hypothetical protein